MLTSSKMLNYRIFWNSKMLLYFFFPKKALLTFMAVWRNPIHPFWLHIKINNHLIRWNCNVVAVQSYTECHRTGWVTGILGHRPWTGFLQWTCSFDTKQYIWLCMTWPKHVYSSGTCWGRRRMKLWSVGWFQSPSASHWSWAAAAFAEALGLTAHWSGADRALHCFVSHYPAKK